MDAIMDPNELLDRTGQGGSPALTLTGFSGTLDHLLALARGQKIDLAGISLTALVDQLVVALRQAPAAMPLGQKGDWVVMAAWLVQLRARLLLPTDMAAQRVAAAEADQLRGRLVGLQEVQALAGWLERRPQLGRDVFARGRPEVFGVSVEAGQAIDVVEFLWASLVLFDDDSTGPETTTVYRPHHLDLFAVADARDRILRRLAAASGELSLEQLLPEAFDQAGPHAPRQILRRRSAWSSTLVASLELAKQGDVALDQSEDFRTVFVDRA
jgi:segregation and condensation protein A